MEAEGKHRQRGERGGSSKQQQNMATKSTTTATTTKQQNGTTTATKQQNGTTTAQEEVTTTTQTHTHNLHTVTQSPITSTLPHSHLVTHRQQPAISNGKSLCRTASSAGRQALEQQ